MGSWMINKVVSEIVAEEKREENARERENYRYAMEASKYAAIMI